MPTQTLKRKEPRKRLKPIKPRPTTTARVKPHQRKRVQPMDEAQLADDILRRAGLLVELDPELKQEAAAWRALPVERQREVTEALKNLRLDPPLSQIVQDMRR
jgi:hypothetical protein